jgi:hypothetical protein
MSVPVRRLTFVAYRSVGSKGMPSSSRVQLLERRETSSVKLSNTTGSSGSCCSSNRSMRLDVIGMLAHVQRLVRPRHGDDGAPVLP